MLCIETFERALRKVRKAFDEVFRLVRPGGIFVITSPLNFRIHAYPDDYWRMTPNCLRRLLSPYAARIAGYQGHHAFPHTVMGVGFKAPAAADGAARAERLVAAYHDWLERTEDRVCPSLKSSVERSPSFIARRGNGGRSCRLLRRSRFHHRHR